MRNYCTLFDSKYLPQGLALYESLVRHSSEDFTLFVLPLDEECRLSLARLGLPKIAILNLEAFVRAMGLTEIRMTRTQQEWAWTCASQLCEYLMDGKFTEVSYLDADLFFFSDPKAVFGEIGERSIGIIPHRLADNDQKRRLEQNGKFNVSLVHFKATPSGRECLAQWAADCREWCFYRNEPGRFADQKYLDVWPGKYGAECCIIENIGVGVAPWNLSEYLVTAGPCVDGVPVVFYHFHELQERPDGSYRLTNYQLGIDDTTHIYGPYLEALRSAKAQIASLSLPVLP